MAVPSPTTVQRQVALDRLRHVCRCLDTLAEIIREPALEGEALVDALAITNAVFEATTNRGDSRRHMYLVDAIGAIAASPLDQGAVERVAGGWGFDPVKFRKAVVAWRAPATTAGRPLCAPS
jgi:hypothetical protein